MYDDRWHSTSYDTEGLWGAPPLTARGRLSHLVFLDGRLVDAWAEDPSETAYSALARQHDAERGPQVLAAAPPRPRHEQLLDWLDGLVGGRDALMVLAPDPEAPGLREVLDPVSNEPWLVVDELVADVRDQLLSPDLGAPLRRCLLLLRERAPWLPERSAPDRIAAGIVWLVGKANASIGPAGPVTQASVATHLGVSTLSSHGAAVARHVRRLGWTAPRPWPHDYGDLYATGRPELLAASVVEDLVRIRDQAFAAQARVLPSEVES